MAHRDQFTVFLRGHDARDLRDRQHIALADGALADPVHRRLCHADRRGGARHAIGLRLFAHVHHAGAALFVKMRQLHLHPPIANIPRCVSVTPVSSMRCRAGFIRMPRRMAASSSAPERPRSASSASECRQGLSFPSAVMRILVQSAQKAQLIGSISPTVPRRSRQAVQLRDAAAARGTQLRHAGEDLLRGQKALRRPRRAHAHRHQLDEPHLPRLFCRQANKVADLIVIHAAEQHAVELDVLEARALRRLDAAQRVFQLACARDLAVALRSERIKTDVQPVHAGCLQRRSQLFQPRAVRGQAKLLDPGDCAQHGAQLYDPAPDQRLAAGHAELRHAERRGGRREVPQLLKGAQLLVSALADALLRHAVAAAKVAKLRHRQPQITDIPAKCIFHRAPILSFAPIVAFSSRSFQIKCAILSDFRLLLSDYS